MTDRILICGPEPGTDGGRPVHASYKTKGVGPAWDESNDGRWMHVGHGDSFAATIEQITCRSCLSYIEADLQT